MYTDWILVPIVLGCYAQYKLAGWAVSSKPAPPEAVVMALAVSDVAAGCAVLLMVKAGLIVIPI